MLLTHVYWHSVAGVDITISMKETCVVMIGKNRRTSFQLIISRFYSNKILCHIPSTLMIHLWRKLSVSHTKYVIVLY